MKGACCCVLVLAGCVLGLATGFPHSRKARNYLLGRHTALMGGPMVTSAPHYTVKWYEQRLDHFNAAEDRTFKQRYLVNEEKWDRRGPILLYTGNEGDITWFCNNTGFMFDLSARLKGLVIFIEHRYYGESLPFGNASYKDTDHLGYLTSEQALADFAVLITYLKDSVYKTRSPVIALGGSYGGMLAAWMRMKYPNVVIGSLAASAPVWWFTGLTPCNSASLTITKDFEQATPGWPDCTHLCSEAIRSSWKAFERVAKEEGGPKWLSDTFGLCHELEGSSSVDKLMSWVSDTWFNMAMADYPYPASFLEPLPAWPINKTCQFLSKQFSTDTKLLEAIASSLRVYYNSTGQSKCYNLDQDATMDMGEQGWNFQACTEMIMPMCSDGVKDMFQKIPWDLKTYMEGCEREYGVTPLPYFVETMYGGKNISSHSNIIFSNGLLDPWHGGGVLQSISDSLVALIIPNGAHHLDLRAAGETDPEDVTQVRDREIAIMEQWIEDFY